MSSRFADLLEIPEGLESVLDSQVPDFAFRLIQLAEIPFDKISGTPAGILVMRVLKAEVSGSLLDDAVWDEALIQQLSRTMFEFVLRYIVEATHTDKGAVQRKISLIKDSNIRTTAMTVAQQFRQEGRQEGIFVGQIRMAQKMLRRASTPEDVLEKLPLKELQVMASALEKEILGE